MRRRLLSGLLAAALFACQAESFTDAPAIRATLLPGFQSYAAKEEVLPQLQQRNILEVVEDSALPADDSRPPFAICVIRVVAFTHEGQIGELQLSFFNNRLQQTTFFPRDSSTYLARLSTQGLDLDSRGHRASLGNTTIWSSVDFRGRVYVAWADQRLQDQSNRWIARYS